MSPPADSLVCASGQFHTDQQQERLVPKRIVVRKARRGDVGKPGGKSSFEEILLAHNTQAEGQPDVERLDRRVDVRFDRAARSLELPAATQLDAKAWAGKHVRGVVGAERDAPPNKQRYVEIVYADVHGPFPASLGELYAFHDVQRSCVE